MSRGSNLVKNIFVISIGNFLPKIASFITLPILTAYLTQSEYGTYDLITVLISLLLPALTLQIQAAAFRFLLENRRNEGEKKKIISSIYAFIIPIIVVTVIALYFALGKIAPSIRLWICVYFAADSFAVNTRQIARGLGQNRDYSVSAVISALIKMILAVFLVRGLQQGLTGAVIALAVSAIISYIYIVVRVGLFGFLDLHAVDRKSLKKMIQYSWPIVPSELSMWVMRMSDRLVISAFLGLAANGVYAVANKIPSIITLAQSAFTLAWQENATLAADDKDVAQYYSDMFSMIYGVMGGFFSCVIACMPVLFRILIRGDYNEAYQQMPILCLAVFFAAISTFFGGIYIAYKNSRSVGMTTVVAAGINLLVDFSFIKGIGLYAASVSTLVSYIALCFYRMIDVKKMVKIQYDFRRIWLINGVMVAECVLSYMQNRTFDILNVLIAILGMVIFNMKLVKKLWKKMSLVLFNHDR